MYVYVIGPESGPYKIGIALNPEKRLVILQTGCYLELLIHAQHKVDGVETARRTEKLAHRALHHTRIRGEWFSCDLEEAKAAIFSDVNAPSSEQQAALDHERGEVHSFSEWLSAGNISIREVAQRLGCSPSAALHWKSSTPPKYIRMACYALSTRLAPIE